MLKAVLDWAWDWDAGGLLRRVLRGLVVSGGGFLGGLV